MGEEESDKKKGKEKVLTAAEQQAEDAAKEKRRQERNAKRAIKLRKKCATRPNVLQGWIVDVAEMGKGEVISSKVGNLMVPTTLKIAFEEGVKHVPLDRKETGKAGRIPFQIIAKSEKVWPKKNGFLMKRAIVSGRNWRKRFFMLVGPELIYYKFNNKHKNQPRGIFNLMGRCLVKVYFDECEEAPENKPFCFNITSTVRGQSLIASGRTEEDMRAWVLFHADFISAF
jgi:hypothetical protein